MRPYLLSFRGSAPDSAPLRADSPPHATLGKLAACLVAVAIAGAASGCATSDSSGDLVSDEGALRAAGGIVEVTGFGSNPGQLKMFEHAPPNLPKDAPLVVVLHGCTQRAADIAQTGWNELADANGFTVLYPEQQTSNSPVRCFSWATPMGSPDDLVRGKGENESVRQMVAKATLAHDVDPRRVYVAGFSAGAGMAIVLAATWPDVFAGAASFAGIPFDCAATFPEVSSCMNPGKDRTAADWSARVRRAFPGYEGPWPRISIWQGSADNVVGPKNRTHIARQWTSVHGLAEAPSATDTVDGQKHATWANAKGEVLVETYEVAGMGHGLPVKPGAGCGRTGQYALDRGICGSQHVAKYFGLIPRL
jgi:poly(hydroxyalkanoate) depolymerase family esterase